MTYGSLNKRRANLKQLIKYLIVFDGQFNPLTDDPFVIRMVAELAIPDKSLVGMNIMVDHIWDRHYAPNAHLHAYPTVIPPSKSEFIMLIREIAQLEEKFAIQLINEMQGLTGLYIKLRNL